MFKRIKRIQKLGIFNDYAVEESFHDFARFNLFYGCNGCGKTTLSRLFSMFDKKVVDQLFQDCEFEVILSDDSSVKTSNLTSFPYKLYVFNQAFVEENINWRTQGAKNIVIISQDRINERDKYFELKDKMLPAKQTLLENARRLVSQAEKDRDNFLTTQAKAIKQSFQFIDTTDSRYMNYDRGKIRSFIEANKDKVEDPGSILDNKRLEDLKKKIQPIFKPAVEFNSQLPDTHQCVAWQTKISKLLGQSVVSQVIDRLKDHQDINSWVEDGLHIHVTHNSSTCEFCTQQIPAARFDALKNHFSDAYVRLIEQLNAALEWINSIQPNNTVPEESAIYDEFKDDFTAVVKLLRLEEQKFAQKVDDWKNKLTEKTKNVFETSLSIEANITEVFAALQNAITKVGNIVSNHNAKAGKFAEQLAKDKNLIELHFVAEAVRDSKYFSMLDAIIAEQKKVDFLDEDINKLVAEKRALEAELANTAIAADAFNRELHKFLGRTDISLVYDAQQKGYRIVRSGSGQPAQHLSEGEKTAIAFVYFSIKLKENGNKIEDSIIVVDDPISSFDSTYLFNSFSYLKHTCEKAAQLFVLTHNFQYFKLVREWMIGKNKSNKPVKSRVYSIDVLKKSPRQSVISNAHETLLRHGSEYHFFFRKLYGFRQEEILNLESAFQVANYARKMLEAFFSFKHPKARDNFYELMREGCKHAGVEQTVTDRIYRFINAYSHNQVVEFHDSTADNLMGEGQNITNDVLHVMSVADKVHYDELVELCG